MNTYQIGLFIKNSREQQGINQRQLCRGVCDHATLSRIECGKQEPSYFILKLLLQRLGLPENRLQILMGQLDFQVSQLQREITQQNIYQNFPQALEKIGQLEALCAAMEEPGRTIVAQYLLRAKALAGYYEDGRHKSYSFAQKRELLLQALEMTCPGIALDNIKAYLLGEDEAKIINQLALTYSEEGDRLAAIEIYRQLLRYIQSHFAGSEVNDVMLPLTAYNYSRLLGLEHRPKEAIAIAELGRRCCVQSNKCRMLGGLLLNLACCFHDLGEDEKSRELLVESYYVHKAMERPKSCDVVQKYAWETFQMKID